MAARSAALVEFQAPNSLRGHHAVGSSRPHSRVACAPAIVVPNRNADASSIVGEVMAGTVVTFRGRAYDSAVNRTSIVTFPIFFVPWS